MKKVAREIYLENIRNVWWTSLHFCLSSQYVLCSTLFWNPAYFKDLERSLELKHFRRAEAVGQDGQRGEHGFFWSTIGLAPWFMMAPAMILCMYTQVCAPNVGGSLQRALWAGAVGGCGWPQGFLLQRSPQARGAPQAGLELPGRGSFRSGVWLLKTKQQPPPLPSSPSAGNSFSCEPLWKTDNTNIIFYSFSASCLLFIFFPVGLGEIQATVQGKRISWNLLQGL